jgi:hypothetical protein
MLGIEPFEVRDLALGVLVAELLIPVAVAITSSVLIWKRKLGRITLQRMLVQDNSRGRPIWKLVARSAGRPIRKCAIQVGGRELIWEGINGSKLDIGANGIGIAPITCDVKPRSTVKVKSGSFSIFGSSFSSLEEVCMTDLRDHHSQSK